MREAKGNDDFQRTLWGMCELDPLFYVNAFCFTYDPRKEPSTVPFITWGFQDDSILEILGSIGERDVLIEKSRDMGASWILLTAFEWVWHFKDGMSFLLLSRNEDYVDKTGNPKSLFWKIDFIHSPQCMPYWLMPSYDRQKLHLENLSNGSVIDGESTTGDAGRGDRRTAVMLDEFSAFAPEDGYKALAATRDVTRSRFFNFTPRGANNAAYDMAQSDIKKLRLHWSSHPEKNPGLYTSNPDETGIMRLEVLDKSYVFPKNYLFVLDGKTRSPWYDVEYKRCASDSEAAQEIDINYLGSGHQYFETQLLDKLLLENGRAPNRRGDLAFDDQSAEPGLFTDSDEGRMVFWLFLDMENKPPADREYVMGIDVATGTGATPSCISVADRKTGEKIAEYINSRIDPARFAYQAVAIAKWLNDAYMLWEANGPGRIFGNRILESGYRNIFYRKNELSLSKKVSDTPGWFSTKDNKLVMLGEYRRALAEGHFINHSTDAINECRQYVYAPDGGVDHSRALVAMNATENRENHGDRVIADGLAWKGVHEMPARPFKVEPEIPVGSLAYRRQKAKELAEQKAYW